MIHTPSPNPHSDSAPLLPTILDTLTAYVQHYAPIRDTVALSQTVLSLVPLIGDNTLTKTEVYGLLTQVVDSFDLDVALTAQVNPAVLNVAHALAKSLSQKPLEVAVTETLAAYIDQWTDHLVTIGEDLIEKALQAVLHHHLDFDLNLDLAIVDRQLLINQVSFQLNLLEQSPPPSKTAQRIAAELATEVQAFKEHRQDNLGPVDVTAKVLGNGDLSVSSPFTSQRQPNVARGMADEVNGDEDCGGG